MERELLLTMALRLTHLVDQLDAHLAEGESPLYLMQQIQQLLEVLKPVVGR